MTKNEYHSWLVKRGIVRDTTPVRLGEGDKHSADMIVIDNFAFPLPKGVPDPEWKVHNAMDALMTIMRHRPPTDLIDQYHLRPIWQDWMMFLLPHVAEHYGVSRHDVLEKWFKEWGLSITMGRKLPIFGYVPGEPMVGAAEALMEWERRFGRDSKKDAEIRSEDRGRA